MAEGFADAIVVAAGSSTRMGGVDKVEALVGGRTLLEWSVAHVAAAASVKRVVVVVRPDRLASTAALLPDTMVVAGGERRSDSARNGVAATDAEVVLIHDAARPLATSALTDSVAAAAREHGAAVPVVTVADSLKRAAGGLLLAMVDRTDLVRAQTPQGARRDVLVGALRAARRAAFTDEAALLQSQGVPVATVPGEPANIKVTGPGDLELVRAVAAARGGDGASATTFGLGQDTHGFGPDLGLLLGGIELVDAPRLHGHSDGDVILHAAATAVLSAAGLGDLGQLFPAHDMNTRGIASGSLLRAALERALEAGWIVDLARVSLVGARPRLGSARIDQMRSRLAELLGIGRAEVSIVASTGNLYGPEGAGRAISATCVIRAHRR